MQKKEMAPHEHAKKVKLYNECFGSEPVRSQFCRMHACVYIYYVNYYWTCKKKGMVPHEHAKKKFFITNALAQSLCVAISTACMYACVYVVYILRKLLMHEVTYATNARALFHWYNLCSWPHLKFYARSTPRYCLQLQPHKKKMCSIKTTISRSCNENERRKK